MSIKRMHGSTVNVARFGHVFFSVPRDAGRYVANFGKQHELGNPNTGRSEADRR